jgi:hypothetical protein
MIIGLFIYQKENKIGWQKDTSTRYMTFVTAMQKNIITIVEKYYTYILYYVKYSSVIIDNDNEIGLASDLIMGLIKVSH